MKLILGPIIEREQIPENLFARCIHPADIRDFEPVPVTLRVLVIPPAGEKTVREVEGHIGSSAYFEGMDFQRQPKTVDAKNMTGQTIFWSANNNNGQEILFRPTAPDYHMDSLEAFAMAPAHSTWQPSKVVLLSFPYGNKEERMSLWRETLDTVDQFHRDWNTSLYSNPIPPVSLALESAETLEKYLATAGYFKYRNPYRYIHAVRYLRNMGFDIPEV